MTTAAKEVGDVPAIAPSADLRSAAKEASAMVRAAEMAMERLASHGIVESLSFELMVSMLNEAADGVGSLVEQLEISEPKVIFSCDAAAEAWIERNPLTDPDAVYLVRSNGAGRYAVAVYRLAGYL